MTHTIRTVAGRAALVAAISDALSSLNIEEPEALEYNGECTLTLSSPYICAMLILSPRDERRGCAPMIHWHKAIARLSFVPGAWSSVNQFHGRKATGFPGTWTDAIEALRIGFTAAQDGSAFQRAAA